jgi:hypothetical protein
MLQRLNPVSVYRFLPFFLFWVAACSPSTQPAALKTDFQKTRPTWLSAKPANDAYYIGIGHSTKTGENNYLQIAKKSALQDLVSEIKVTVSSTSILTSIDENKEFRDKYEQIIQTEAADEIEEFEQVDVWEDERNYWVYYRLSKQRYREIKEQQKRDAVALALDLFTKARQSEKSAKEVEALGFYFQGFRAIEKYLAEPIRLIYEGNEILLTTEIYASMQKLLTRMELTATPAQVDVNRRVTTNGQAITLNAFMKENNRAIEGLPLTVAFEKGSGDVFPTYKTDAGGQAKMLLTKIGSRDLEQTVAARVDLAAFAGSNPNEIYSLIAQKMVVPKAVVLLKVKRPLVHLVAQEKTFGTARATLQVSNRIKNYLTNNGFEFTENKASADLLMDVTADSEKGSVSGSIYITFMTAVINVTSATDNKKIYSTTLDRIKGFSLDYDRSSQEAYNKGLEILEKEKLPELLNAILQ